MTILLAELFNEPLCFDSNKQCTYQVPAVWTEARYRALGTISVDASIACVGAGDHSQVFWLRNVIRGFHRPDKWIMDTASRTHVVPIYRSGGSDAH